MSKPRLGEIRESAGCRYMLTANYPHGLPHGCGFRVWTPVPEGMSEMDLGRKFPAAQIEYSLEPNEKLEEWPSDG